MTTLRRRLSLLGVLSALIAAGGIHPPASAATSTGFFDDDDRPDKFRISHEWSPLEVGLRFTTERAELITGVQVYKPTDDKGDTPTTGSLWNEDGELLARTTFTPTEKVGWISVSFDKPVRASADETYTVSVYEKSATYASTLWGLTSPLTTSGASTQSRAGVYLHSRSTGFPYKVWNASNYWVDVQLAEAPNSDPTAAPTSSPSPTPTRTTTSPSPTASTSPTPTLSNSPTTSPSPTPTRTTTSPSPTASTSPTASPSATPTSSAGLKGWQLTERNIGLAPFGLSCGQLPVYSGPLKPPAGARITGVRIVGNLDLSAGDIIVERSCIKPTSGDNRALVSNDICGPVDCLVTSPLGITIRDSEFDASDIPASQIAASCAFRGVGTLQRNYIHGMGSGICFFGTGFLLSGLAEQNYVTGLRAAGSSHNEAATIRDLVATQVSGRTVRFINNRLNCETGNDTGGLFIQPTWDDIANVYVEGNYIEGGGYNLFLNQAGGTYRNTHSVNNRFRPTGWGPSTVMGGPGWTEWSENYIYDPGQIDGKGRVVVAS